MHQLFIGFKPISGLGSLQMGKMVIIWPAFPLLSVIHIFIDGIIDGFHVLTLKAGNI